MVSLALDVLQQGVCGTGRVFPEREILHSTGVIYGVPFLFFLANHLRCFFVLFESDTRGEGKSAPAR